MVRAQRGLYLVCLVGSPPSQKPNSGTQAQGKESKCPTNKKRCWKHSRPFHSGGEEHIFQQLLQAVTTGPEWNGFDLTKKEINCVKEEEMSFIRENVKRPEFRDNLGPVRVAKFRSSAGLGRPAAKPNLAPNEGFSFEGKIIGGLYSIHWYPLMNYNAYQICFIFTKSIGSSRRHALH